MAVIDDAGGQTSDFPSLVIMHKVKIVKGNGGKLKYCQDRAS